MGKHSEKGGTSAMHASYRWLCADASQRFGLSVTAPDLGKIAWQQDVGGIYILIDHAQVANAAGWRRIDGGAELATGLTGAANTLALIHANTLVSVSHGSATALTVPPNSSVAFKIGDQMAIVQEGAGALTIVEGGGVTIRCRHSLAFAGQYAVASLIKRETDTWLLAGDLT